MRTDLTPVFLFSLPRSGSTFAQRVLAGHPDIATASEPWALLPVFSGLEMGLCKARYDQSLLVQALADFCNVLPGGRDSYSRAVRAFALELYRGAMQDSDARYFLDKTPRYHLIIQHIMDTFPEARFIILWRNPLAILGSRIHSYGGVWRAHNYHVDLYDGLANLVRVFEKNRDRIYAIRFEDMVSRSEQVFRSIFDYLGLPFHAECLDSFSNVSLEGSMGDKSGVQEYTAISDKPLEKWKETLASPVRKAWCRRYLRWIGEQRLQLMGYSMSELMGEIEALPANWGPVPNDILRLAHSHWQLWRTSGYL